MNRGTLSRNAFYVLTIPCLGISVSLESFQRSADREGSMVWRKPTIEPIRLSMEITAYSLARK